MITTEDIRTPVPRLIAMSRGCLLLHPECSHCGCQPPECKLRRTLHEVGGRMRRDVETMAEIEAALTAIPAIVRSDWVRPVPPEAGYFLSVYLDGDEWHMHWFSDTHLTDYIAIEGPDAWPFVEEAARTRDWQKLGITVIA